MSILLTVKPPARATKSLLSLEKVINSKTIIALELTDNDQKSDLLATYLIQKPSSVYKIPNTKPAVMKGSFFVDPKTLKYTIDPTDWWVSEKLDGIRAIWTGKSLHTRTGKIINAPDWFTAEFPKEIALDGELYVGRGRMSDVQSIVLDNLPQDKLWTSIKYCIFDIPDSGSIPFELVQKILRGSLPKIPFLRVIEQEQLSGLDELEQIQKTIVSQGGEGTMIRRPGSLYEVGVTCDLLKFKSHVSSSGELEHLYDDDGVIVGYNYNYDIRRVTGEPIIKSIIVRWVDTNKFNLNPEFSVSHHITQEEKRGNYKKLFPIGGHIKVLYTQLFDSQKPRYPRYGGVIQKLI